MRKDMCAEVRIGMFKLSKKENGLNIIIVGCSFWDWSSFSRDLASLP